MPTMVTLAASLPQFQHHCAMTSVLKSPFETQIASNEEALDKTRSCLMEGMHLLNKVTVHTRARTDQLSKCQIVFEEDLEVSKQLRTLHEKTEEEAKELREEVANILGSNQTLVRDLSQAIG